MQTNQGAVNPQVAAPGVSTASPGRTTVAVTAQVVVAKLCASGLCFVGTGPRHHGRVVVAAEPPVLGLGDVAMWHPGCTGAR